MQIIHASPIFRILAPSTLRGYQATIIIPESEKELKNAIEHIVFPVERLVVDLGLGDWHLRLGIPDDLVFLVEVGGHVGDGDDLASILHLLSGAAGRVARNPQHRRLRSDARVEISIALHFRCVQLVRIGKVAGNHAPHRRVVGVDVGPQELLEYAGSLMGRHTRVDTVFRRGCLLVAVGRRVGALAGREIALIRKQTTLLLLKTLGKVLQKGIESSVQRDVIQSGEDQEDDHQDERSKSTLVAKLDSEETNETALGNVETNEELLQSTGIDQALGVDVDVVHEEKIVPVGEIEEPHSNGGEQKDERRNAGIADSFQRLATCIIVRRLFSLTNDEQVRVNGENGTPAKTGQRNPALVHLARSRVEQFAQNLGNDQPNESDEEAGDNTQTLQHKV